MIVHATSVAIDGRGVLIMGASGTGKSGLALELMALGARLVADDQTLLELHEGNLIARCPDPIRNLIEARGLGLLNADSVPEVALSLCIDLDRPETERLPPRRKVTFMERPLDLVWASPHRHFPSAIMHYVRFGRRDQGWTPP